MKHGAQRRTREVPTHLERGEEPHAHPQSMPGPMAAPVHRGVCRLLEPAAEAALRDRAARAAPMPGSAHADRAAPAGGGHCFPGGIALDDPLTVTAAFEALAGLIIEVSFIATFMQRFLDR